MHFSNEAFHSRRKAKQFGRGETKKISPKNFKIAFWGGGGGAPPPPPPPA